MLAREYGMLTYDEDFQLLQDLVNPTR